jgi:hypothetical protein
MLKVAAAAGELLAAAVEDRPVRARVPACGSAAPDRARVDR